MSSLPLQRSTHPLAPPIYLFGPTSRSLDETQRQTSKAKPILFEVANHLLSLRGPSDSEDVSPGSIMEGPTGTFRSLGHGQPFILGENEDTLNCDLIQASHGHPVQPYFWYFPILFTRHETRQKRTRNFYGQIAREKLAPHLHIEATLPLTCVHIPCEVVCRSVYNHVESRCSECINKHNPTDHLPSDPHVRLSSHTPALCSLYGPNRIYHTGPKM